MFKYRTQKLLVRVALLAISVTLLLLGTTTWRREEPDYPNYWGGRVLVLIPLIGGLLLAYVALFRLDRFMEGTQRVSGKLRRRRLKEDKHKHPIDDFDKPWTGGLR